MVMHKDIYLYITLFVLFSTQRLLCELGNSYNYLMLYCKLFEILDGGWKLTCQLSSTLQGTTQDVSNPFTVPVLISYTLFIFALHSLWKVNIRPRHVIGRPVGRPTSQSDCSSLLDYSIETVSGPVFIIQYNTVFNLLSSPAHLSVQL